MNRFLRASFALAFVVTAGNLSAQSRQEPFFEPFDTLNPKIWTVQLYGFPANGCSMTPRQVTVAGSALTLRVERSSRGESLPYVAGEIGSERFFLYGEFRVRMKTFAGSGGVSSFFLMNRWQSENWEHREIDIEILGRNPKAIQMTTHDFQNGGRDWKSAATTVDLGFDSSKDFHDYTIVWTPDSVRWYADGRLLHTETRYVPHEMLQIRINAYVGNEAEPGIVEWLGRVDESALPSTAVFLDVEYRPLDPIR